MKRRLEGAHMTLLLIEAARILKLDPAQGWPQTISNYGLAALQTYREGADNKTWRSKARTWREALALAVASGVIEHTSTTERVQVAPAVRRVIHPGLGSSEWDERGFESRSFLGGTLRTAYTKPAQHRDVTRHHITAPVFAVWLAAQGQEPSPHIAAWFKAVGVTPTAPATDTAPPAPVVASVSSAQAKGRRDVLTPAIETAQKECPDPFDAPAVWAVLVSMAGAGAAPLLGASDEGIKWLNSNDEPRFLTLKNLRERLNRKRKTL